MRALWLRQNEHVHARSGVVFRPLRKAEDAHEYCCSVHNLGEEQCVIVSFLKEGEARDRLRAMKINVHGAVRISGSRPCQRAPLIVASHR